MANGIYTNSELVQSIIGDLNAMLKQQMVGEHVTACVILTGAVQKLANLKATIDNDLKNRDETIQMLK